jgi:hypothetical protein
MTVSAISTNNNSLARKETTTGQDKHFDIDAKSWSSRTYHNRLTDSAPRSPRSWNIHPSLAARVWHNLGYPAADKAWRPPRKPVSILG